MNSKSLNLKVYLKSKRDLDLELVAIIAMSPTTNNGMDISRSSLTLKKVRLVILEFQMKCFNYP